MGGATTSTTEAAEALKRWLLSDAADVGSVTVVDVQATLDVDSEGDPILRFVVTLADPTDETWLVEDVVRFHERVDDRAVELGLPLPWHVALEAQTQDELDPSDSP